MRNRTAMLALAVAMFGATVLLTRPRVEQATARDAGSADSSAVIHVREGPFAGLVREMRAPPRGGWSLPLTDVGLESAPVALAAGDGRVFLGGADGAVVSLDAGTRRVVWRANGATLRSVLRRLVPAGHGALLVLGGPDDSVTVLDEAKGFVRGRWRAPSFLQSGCALKGALLFAAPDSEPLVLVDRHGARIGAPALPWSEFREAHPLQRQLVMAGNGTTCVAALVTGPGFATFTSTGAPRVARYAEFVPTPDALVTVRRLGLLRREVTARLASRELAAQDAAVMGGVVYLAFAGRSPRGGRIVDRFQAGDGRYLDTFEFESRVLRLAAADGCVYVVRYEHGLPVLACFPDGPQR